MKIKVEADITPKELLELFEGNIDALQKAMLNMLLQTMPKAGVGENNAVEFWKMMAQKSQDMFEQYQKSFKTAKRDE